jgi:hypothetical protein
VQCGQRLAEPGCSRDSGDAGLLLLLLFLQLLLLRL